MSQRQELGRNDGLGSVRGCLARAGPPPPSSRSSRRRAEAQWAARPKASPAQAICFLPFNPSHQFHRDTQLPFYIPSLRGQRNLGAFTTPTQAIMSAPASPPPSYSSTCSEVPIFWLPPEVVTRILSHLPRPLDLYQASLVCSKWRAIATNPRLWQEHYWAFYRVALYPETDEERLLAKFRTASRRKAMRVWVDSLRVPSPPSSLKPLPTLSPAYGSERRTVSYPTFLNYQTQEERGLLCPPDFYTIFARRLNQDQRLLNDLRAHVALESHMLDGLLNIIDRYGNAAKDLLFALCATQQLTSQSISTFTEAAHLHGAGIDSHWPSALGVHTHSKAQPNFDFCISLRSAAEQVLGHLQRRDALWQMKKLQARRSHQPPATQTLRERVGQACTDLEEALQAIALFRLGEPSELSSYLDLVALHVWQELHASIRWRANDPSHPPPQADDASQASTTRQRSLRILDALHRLGFGHAGQDGKLDPSAYFLNGSLYSPAQCSTPPCLFGAILCAVCRRLGVAAAVTSAPGFVVFIEEGEKPQDWLGSQAEWHSFYLVPNEAGGGYQLQEARPVLAFVEDLSYQARGGRSAEEYLQPASHADILYSLATNIVREVQRIGGRFDQAHGSEVKTTLTQTTDPSPSDRDSDLRNHLLGHADCPPWPLLPAMLPSSLALLRTRTEDWPRPSWRDSLRDAAYCMLWIICVGQQRGNDLVAKYLQISAHLQCDLPLLLEAENCDVKEQLGLVRKAMKMAGRIGGAATYAGRLAGGSNPSQAVKDLLVSAFGEDVGPNEGLGGYGGCDGDEREPELLDPAHERNVAVQHRVGTLFSHRQQGYRAVVIGWDCVCRSAESNSSTVRR